MQMAQFVSSRSPQRREVGFRIIGTSFATNPCEIEVKLWLPKGFLRLPRSCLFLRPRSQHHHHPGTGNGGTTATPCRDPGVSPMGSDPHGRYIVMSPGTRPVHTGTAGRSRVTTCGHGRKHWRLAGAPGSPHCLRNGQSAVVQYGGCAVLRKATTLYEMQPSISCSADVSLTPRFSGLWRHWKPPKRGTNEMCAVQAYRKLRCARGTLSASILLLIRRIFNN
jgi:hypothetical protein